MEATLFADCLSFYFSHSSMAASDAFSEFLLLPTVVGFSIIVLGLLWNGIRASKHSLQRNERLMPSRNSDGASSLPLVHTSRASRPVSRLVPDGLGSRLSQNYYRHN
jgi:hypothetical protein